MLILIVMLITSYSSYLPLSNKPPQTSRINHALCKIRYHGESESVTCSVVSESFDPVDWSPPGFSVRGILQARILEWVAIPFSRGSSRPRMEPGSSALQAGSLPSEPPGKPMWWWHSCSLSRAWGTGHLCSMWTQLGQLEA